jgi:hypothetical protein
MHPFPGMRPLTTVVISQPMYFPWPGFFELVSCADIYVHLDDVQFSKGGFTNRIQVKTPNGIKWMTIPLAGKGSFTEIRRLAAATPDFAAAHRALLRQGLRDAQYLGLAMDLFDQVTSRPVLAELLAASIELTMRHLALPSPREWVWSGTLDVPGRSSARVLDLVRRLGGTRYVTAHGAAAYLDHAAFEAAGVEVEYIRYSRTPWPQAHGPFTPFVTILDLLANSGPENAQYFRPSTTPWRDFLAARSVADHGEDQ